MTAAGGAREGVRLAATLAVAGLVSGLGIVSAYRLTLPSIRAHQAEALRRAVFEVLPGATAMERLTWDGATVTAAAAGAPGEESIYAGYDAQGRLVGFAVPAAGAGFQDTIRLIYGLDPAGARVVGMSVLESRETPGLGDKIYKDESFVAEFHGLVVAPVIRLVKGHGEAANEVDAITGATISSKAVVRILNDANARWRPRLPAPGQVPRAAAAAAAVPPDVERGGPVPGGRGAEGR